MKYYFVGIKGTGMSSLAQILFDLGNEIVGYDDAKEHKFTEDPLIERGIKIYTDNSFSPVNEMIVVYSAAFREEHPELVKARILGLKCLKYNEMLGELTKLFKTIAVSGCHGKTTTSSMLAHVIDEIIGCNYVIGDGSGYASVKNDYLVIEACEYRRHFLAYDPTFSIVTNIEMDHVDYYRDMADMKSAYASLINKTKEKVVLCGDDETIRSLNIHENVLYYGFNENNNLRAVNITNDEHYTYFDVYLNNQFYGQIATHLFGNHMVLNTLAVIGICSLINLDQQLVIDSIKTFTGAKRRFKEEIINDTVIIDDYAHHPTELNATIEAARKKYPNRKIIGLFMPNTYSRVQMFYQEFADALNKTDQAFIMDIAKGREKPEEFPGVSSKLILDRLNNGTTITNDEPEKLLPYKGDVLLFMSCQNIYVLEEKLKNLI